MLRYCTESEFEEMSEGGTRYLCRLDNYEFRDTLDGEGFLHYMVVEGAGEEPQYYEADLEVMYEFMARYLAGVYEKEHYEMERSPTHAALLDVMEMATARARSGDAAFAFDQVDEDDGEDLEQAEEGTDEEWRGNTEQ